MTGTTTAHPRDLKQRPRNVGDTFPQVGEAFLYIGETPPTCGTGCRRCWREMVLV